MSKRVKLQTASLRFPSCWPAPTSVSMGKHNSQKSLKSLKSHSEPYPNTRRGSQKRGPSAPSADSVTLNWIRLSDFCLLKSSAKIPGKTHSIPRGQYNRARASSLLAEIEGFPPEDGFIFTVRILPQRSEMCSLAQPSQDLIQDKNGMFTIDADFKGERISSSAFLCDAIPLVSASQDETLWDRKLHFLFVSSEQDARLLEAEETMYPNNLTDGI